MADDVYRARIELEDAASREAAKLDLAIKKLTADYDALARASARAEHRANRGAIVSGAIAISNKHQKAVIQQIALTERMNKAVQSQAQAERMAAQKVRYAWGVRGQAVDDYLKKVGLVNKRAGTYLQRQPGYSTSINARGGVTHRGPGGQFASADDAFAAATIPGYRSIGQRFAAMGAGAQRGIGNLAKSYASLRASLKNPPAPPAFVGGMRNIDSLGKRAAVSIFNLNSNLGRMKDRVMNAIPGLNHLNEAIGVIARSVVRIAFWGGIMLGTTALTLSARAAVNASVAYESASKSFESMLGSAENAKGMMGWTEEFAKTTPFQWPQVVEGARLQSAFGLDPKRWMSVAGDISSAMGQGEEGMRMVSEALGRIKAGQYGEAFEQLRRFGIGQERLRSVGLKFDKGGSPIGKPADVLAAVEAIAKLPPYVGQMAVQMSTTAGMWSNIKDQVWAISLAIGQRMTPGIKKGLDRLKLGLENFTKSAAFDKLLKWVDNLFSDKSIAAMQRRLIKLIAWSWAAGAEIVDAFQVAKDFFKTGIITDTEARKFISKILTFTSIALGLAAAWHLVEASLWAVQIAATAGFDAVAWIGMLKATAMAAALGVGTYFSVKAARTLGLPTGTAEGSNKNPHQSFAERYAAGIEYGESLLGGTKGGKTFAQRFGIPEGGMKNLFGNTMPALTGAVNENTAAQLSTADRLEGIVQKIIGGGPLAAMGIAPVEVARMRGYTDPTGPSGARGNSITITLPPGADQRLSAFVLDIAKQAIEQYISGAKSYSTARSEG
jgi:hypothetical protein